MPDTEAFIERLTAENHDFRTLREEHHRYEQELAALVTRNAMIGATNVILSQPGGTA